MLANFANVTARRDGGVCARSLSGSARTPLKASAAAAASPRSHARNASLSRSLFGRWLFGRGARHSSSVLIRRGVWGGWCSLTAGAPREAKSARLDGSSGEALQRRAFPQRSSSISVLRRLEFLASPGDAHLKIDPAKKKTRHSFFWIRAWLRGLLRDRATNASPSAFPSARIARALRKKCALGRRG